MIVTCDEEHYGFLKDKPLCGKTFDDAECSTICPHDPLPPKPTEDELEALLQALRQKIRDNGEAS